MKLKQMQTAKLKKIPPHVGRSAHYKQPNTYLDVSSNATTAMTTPALHISIPANGVSSNKSTETVSVLDGIGTFVVTEGEQDTCE
jgi:hypothetical protein